MSYFQIKNVLTTLNSEGRLLRVYEVADISIISIYINIPNSQYYQYEVYGLPFKDSTEYDILVDSNGNNIFYANSDSYLVDVRKYAAFDIKFSPSIPTEDIYLNVKGLDTGTATAQSVKLQNADGTSIDIQSAGTTTALAVQDTVQQDLISELLKQVKKLNLQISLITENFLGD